MSVAGDSGRAPPGRPDDGRAPALPAERGSAAFAFRSWWGIAVVLLLGMLAAAGLKSYRDLAEVRLQESELRQRVEATEGRIRRLDERIERIENDPWTLERLAREELGMVRPGDLVIVLPEGRAPEGQTPEEASEADPPATREAGPQETL